MSMQRSRGDPGESEGAEVCRKKPPRPLGDHDPESLEGVSSGERRGSIPSQSGRVIDHYTSAGWSAGGLPVLWREDVEQDGRFLVNVDVLGAADGGIRRSYMERLVFSISEYESDDGGDVGSSDVLPW